ncbi:competence protein ComGF [Streptococcus sp. zg-86]|uniref:Competence protein ComGF n=1 Tax=Streptococcus zhangguiae TaxID=2664091 RepID=A0A6I4RAZ3_9STRE|nr:MULTISPECIES: competence type IV pilus minor pilin ComGF [unclassified Streptococcus]MTB63856.1 competence protein ComGF [Streptococcus sp. zg-86]MTB90166.1 competence protein ComGF [Streptococcus sp. zg-36]MWV55838.1 competence protein ComGF [Streptococcus sp. zg-70]QTH47880.1 competence protein ComGF [Streptococcus sp. zg-86]
MWKKSKVSAFTLLECLVALLVLSGSLLVFEGLTKLIHHELIYQETGLEKKWLVFADQLRYEFEGVRLVKVENNRLYVDKLGQQLSFGKSKSDDFRKTNDKGQGYQPMLYQVASVAIHQERDIVQIDITFDNGWERSFVYRFKEKV